MQYDEMKQPVSILVVDDESSIRDLLKEYLSLEGYKVDTAEDGNDAYTYLRKSYYDIVLTDLEMPGMNGIELLEKANTEGLNHKFIILTGFGTVETAIMALKLGAIDYILKPFKLEELGFIIKKAVHRRRLEEENIQLREALSLYQISEAMILNNNIRAVLDLILEKAMHELDADIVILSLKETISKPLITRVLKSSMDITADELESALNKEKIFKRLESERYMNLTGRQIDQIRSGSAMGFDIRSYLSVAVGLRDRFYGALCAFRVKSDMPFTDAQRKLTTIFGERITTLLEVKRSDEGLQHAIIESIESLVKALEAKDPFTKGHSERVSVYAHIVAERLKLDAKTVLNVTQAGRLHDIGKIGIRYDALTKKDGLDKEEYEQFKLHPGIGANILKPMSFLADIIPMILHHHERYDGKGYPDGLEGENIPLGARILAICDSFDVMTSDRPYRSTLPKEKVKSELRSNSGTQFDPKLVTAMLLLLEEGEIPLMKDTFETHTKA
ncbi:MAG: response regulator [Deltaproteobacteria bacterium]|nr:response regulator [Deltaproteobacteria bacterium]MCL5277473.1 response regulator [Deltaproteobacteria bacterium]